MQARMSLFSGSRSASSMTYADTKTSPGTLYDPTSTGRGARCVPSGITISLLSSVLTHDLLCFEKQKITYFEPAWAGDSLFISCLYPFAACMALSFRSGIGSRGNYLYLASGRDEIYCYLSCKLLALKLMNAFWIERLHFSLQIDKQRSIMYLPAGLP